MNPEITFRIVAFFVVISMAPFAAMEPYMVSSGHRRSPVLI